jgi:murein DD-endopeptidase MepM/ murein hydrolase activator NlpD
MDKRLVVLMLILGMVLAGIVFYSLSSEEKTNPEPQLKASIYQKEPLNRTAVEEIKTTQTQEKESAQPFLSLSSEIPVQADAVIVRVVARSRPNGFFEGKKVDFFRINDKEWLAVFGIDTKASPGAELFRLSFLDGSQIEKEIFIQKRSWSITELEVTQELTEQGYTPENITQHIVQNENVIVGEVISGYKDTPYFRQQFINPLKKSVIVGAFGNIRKSGASELQHLGVDLDAKVGTEVFTVNDGVVVLARDDFRNYGKTLIIDHGLGIFSLYLHLNDIKVSLGQSVKRGELAALSGNTGYSIDPHLHFSIKIRSANVDPLRFIETFNKSFE